MHAVGMFKRVLFWRAKQPYSMRARFPAPETHPDTSYRTPLPGSVLSRPQSGLLVNPRRFPPGCTPYLVFKKFLPVGSIFVAFIVLRHSASNPE